MNRQNINSNRSSYYVVLLILTAKSALAAFTLPEMSPELID